MLLFLTKYQEKELEVKNNIPWQQQQDLKDY